MSRLMRSLRARLFAVFSTAGTLLGLAGLAAVGVESVSFGHAHLRAHLAAVHAFHHHHLYFGSHEHSGAEPGSGREEPAPQDPTAPRTTATVSVAPALFQPAGAGVLAAPLLDSTPLVLVLALPWAVRPAIQPARPRGPPPASIQPSWYGNPLAGQPETAGPVVRPAVRDVSSQVAVYLSKKIKFDRVKRELGRSVLQPIAEHCLGILCWSY